MRLAGAAAAAYDVISQESCKVCKIRGGWPNFFAAAARLPAWPACWLAGWLRSLPTRSLGSFHMNRRKSCGSTALESSFDDEMSRFDPPALLRDAHMCDNGRRRQRRLQKLIF